MQAVHAHPFDPAGSYGNLVSDVDAGVGDRVLSPAQDGAATGALPPF